MTKFNNIIKYKGYINGFGFKNNNFGLKEEVTRTEALEFAKKYNQSPSMDSSGNIVIEISTIAAIKTSPLSLLNPFNILFMLLGGKISVSFKQEKINVLLKWYAKPDKEDNTLYSIEVEKINDIDFDDIDFDDIDFGKQLGQFLINTNNKKILIDGDFFSFNEVLNIGKSSYGDNYISLINFKNGNNIRLIIKNITLGNLRSVFENNSLIEKILLES